MIWAELNWCRRSFARRSLRRFATARAAPNAASAYLGSSPAPAPGLASNANARAAGTFVASDAVAFTEAPKVERTDPQTERFEMRP